MNLDAVFCLMVAAIHYQFYLQQEKFSITVYRKIDPNRNSVVKADSPSFLICMSRVAKIRVLDWCTVV